MTPNPCLDKIAALFHRTPDAEIDRCARELRHQAHLYHTTADPELHGKAEANLYLAALLFAKECMSSK